MKVSANRAGCWWNETKETDKQNVTYKPHFLEKKKNQKSRPIPCQDSIVNRPATTSLMADSVFVFVSMVRQILRGKKRCWFTFSIVCGTASSPTQMREIVILVKMRRNLLPLYYMGERDAVICKCKIFKNK